MFWSEFGTTPFIYDERMVPNTVASESKKRFDEDAAVVNFDDHGVFSLCFKSRLLVFRKREYCRGYLPRGHEE